MPSHRSPRWRVPRTGVLPLVVATGVVVIVLALGAAPAWGRPDGGPPGHHGKGHTPPGQAVAEAHRPSHAGPPPHATAAPPPAAPAAPAPAAPPPAPAAPDPDPAPVPAAPAPTPAATAGGAGTTTAAVASAVPAVAVPEAEAPEPAAPEPAAPRPAAAPSPEPGFPGTFPAGGEPGSATEAARSLSALGLLVGLIALFLLAQGRVSRGDSRLLEAPVESEQREFR